LNRGSSVDFTACAGSVTTEFMLLADIIYFILVMS